MALSVLLRTLAGSLGLAVLVAGALVLAPDYAAARPDSRSMTCEQAKALVKKNGAVVMNTSPTTFDRFVASRRYCVSLRQFLIQADVPTKDKKSCFIGYVCQEERPLFSAY